MASQYQQQENRPHGLVSFPEYVENCSSKNRNKLVDKKQLPVFTLFYFANNLCLQFPFSQYEKLKS